uniref:GAT domain-containing protein n=1 Tax=Elaeophora elaphi TaxID=1147741 RepID=A0A0R3RRN2_9BILA
LHVSGYHYIPFAKRRSQSVNIKRQTGDKSYRNELWNKVSEQSRPYPSAKQNTRSNKHSFISSSSFNAAFASTNRFGRPVAIQARNNPLRFGSSNQQRSMEITCNSSGLKIPPQTANFIFETNAEEMEQKLDQFKNDVLDDIIQCGVYTDRVIQECISRNVIEYSTLTMASLQQAVNELLRDIGAFNTEVNKMTRTANAEPTNEEIPNYEDEEFESDEGESLSVIASMKSDSEKLAKEDKSVASSFGSVPVRTTHSLTTLSNSSVSDTSD